MRPGARAVIVVAVVALALGAPGWARADETDNFTCRSRLSKDSLVALDAWMNARIREAVDRANRRGGSGCDASCLVRELQDAIGRSVPRPPVLIPHSRFVAWIDGQPDIDRCHLAFRETIYGARRYNQPWLYPINHRIIFVADSILVSGRVVGIDKIDHFIREGLEHWRAIDRDGGDIASSMAREVGSPGGQFGWTEYGLKGMSLTGVFAYADLAAGYFGYRFWHDLLSLGRPESFVAFDEASRRATQRREFSFAAYVNDAWDEGVNYSTFHPALAGEVASALQERSLTLPVRDCRALAGLPDARLYVNPGCLGEPRTLTYVKATGATRSRAGGTRECRASRRASSARPGPARPARAACAAASA